MHIAFIQSGSIHSRFWYALVLFCCCCCVFSLDCFQTCRDIEWKFTFYAKSSQLINSTQFLCMPIEYHTFFHWNWFATYHTVHRVRCSVGRTESLIRLQSMEHTLNNIIWICVLFHSNGNRCDRTFHVGFRNLEKKIPFISNIVFWLTKLFNFLFRIEKTFSEGQLSICKIEFQILCSYFCCCWTCVVIGTRKRKRTRKTLTLVQYLLHPVAWLSAYALQSHSVSFAYIYGLHPIYPFRWAIQCALRFPVKLCHEREGRNMKHAE